MKSERQIRDWLGKKLNNFTFWNHSYGPNESQKKLRTLERDLNIIAGQLHNYIVDTETFKH